MRGDPASDRFWAKVNKNGAIQPHMDTNCWVWMASKNPKGYGQFGPGGKGKSIVAHRFSYTLNVGEIPKGMLVCHRCDNPPCVRPDHLFLGTVTDNNRDRAAKGRSALMDRDRNPRARIRTEDVLDIVRRMNGGDSVKAIAGDYGVTIAGINNLRYDPRYRHLIECDGRRKIPKSEMTTIIKRIQRGDTLTSIAQDYGVGVTNISYIKRKYADKAA